MEISYAAFKESGMKDKIVGAPPFIELALFGLISSEIYNPGIYILPCAVHDIMLDWRLRAVDSRLDELSVQLDEKASVRQTIIPYEHLAKLKMKPHNPNSYTNSTSL